ncbi:CLUMA_CG017509, isoform A [Clunio marinus]|uniref:CLUMA_CG017509, isoform A n=1 Tax=Clunio marinus TaxID=568069 RepID=A0A1J1IW75_9DIPT|nr:CLUMA_CG017509, isoform A [Clunio marinus]
MSEAPPSENNNMDQNQQRTSPPKAIVDSSPLQSAMDKNRESLKVKLLVRRSANQLVEQGILPPLKTSPAIHEQKKLLERAKTGDLLKAKIQQRPAREELERRHILESHEGHVDPSLADKYRMLEKAILVDQLNSKISHRPGPIDLIEKNILHANEPIERIVKEGLFKVSGGQDTNAEKNFLSFEDDSQSSESDVFQQSSSQSQNDVIFTNNLVPDLSTTSTAATSKGVINISLVPTNNILTTTSTPISVATFKIQHSGGEKGELSTISIPPPPPPPKLITYHVKPILQTEVKGIINTQNFIPLQIADATTASTVNVIPALVPSQVTNVVNHQQMPTFTNNNQKFSAPGKEKNRKKCKNKAVSKARAIKFHEYKGPPNKSSASSSSASIAANKKLGETNYELIMQQQCLLEYLEGIYKNPNAQSHVAKTEISEMSSKDANKVCKMDKTSEYSVEKVKTINKPHVTIFPSKPSVQQTSTSLNNINNNNNNIVMESSKDAIVTDVGKLSKMKVSELKAYLKRVNLPVSGPKPLLIERLKPYLPLKPLEDNSDDTSISSNVMSEGNDFYNASLPSVSSTESEMDNMDGQSQNFMTKVCSQGSLTSMDEDIVAEQQRKIEELQRKLQQSQHELEKMKQTKSVEAPSQSSIVFDPQFHVTNPIPTVFLVDVSKATPVQEDIHEEVGLPSPFETQPSNQQQQQVTPSKISIIKMENQDVLVTDQSDPLSKPTNVEVTETSTTTPIPMSQDITDVLEILLKNGEWPEMSEDVKHLANNFIHSNDNSNFSNNISTAKQFNDNTLASHNHFNILSPMNINENPVSPILQVTEESIDKMLEAVSPSSGRFSGTYNQAFPMDIEDDTTAALVNGDFNHNAFQNSGFPGNSYQNMQTTYDEQQRSSNSEPKMENCDNKYSEYMKNVKPNESNLITEKSPRSQKNGLIGNFDHNLFDALKSSNLNNNNNNINSNSNINNNNNINNCNSVMNELFSLPHEGKYAKDDSKSLINSLNFSNNFDLFSTGIDNTAMDFESIIPYNDLQSHDSLFQISAFDSGRGTSLNDPSGSLLFNDIIETDTRMSNGDGMTCEVDNLLCNL